MRWGREVTKANCYSLPNVIAFLFINILRYFKIKWFENNKYVICSEICADYLEKCGVKIKKGINSLLSPGDLPEYFDIKLIK